MSIQYFMSMIYHYIVEHTQPRALIISKFIFKFDSIHLSRSMKKYLDNEKWLHCPRPAVKIPERPFGNERKTWHVWKKREGKISRRIKDPGQGWWSLRVAAVRRDEARRARYDGGDDGRVLVACRRRSQASPLRVPPPTLQLAILCPATTPSGALPRRLLIPPGSYPHGVLKWNE